MKKFAIGFAFGFVGAAMIAAVAPPLNPSWWKDITQDDLDLLAVHVQKADEITVRDSHTIMQLFFDHQLLKVFEETNRQMVLGGNTSRATPKEILEVIDDLRDFLKKEIVENEKKQKKNQEEEQVEKPLGRQA